MIRYGYNSPGTPQTELVHKNIYNKEYFRLISISMFTLFTQMLMELVQSSDDKNDKIDFLLSCDLVYPMKF